MDHRRVWEKKPVLREVYHDLYRRMAAACVPGRTLEIGGGTGNLREWWGGEVISCDIQPFSWLDVVADAHRLPFADASMDNLMLFDVLHHLARPRLFFSEAARVLRPGGRVVMMEPGVTPASWLMTKLAHPEPLDMSENPLIEGDVPPGRDPWDANIAIPTLLFVRNPQHFSKIFPELPILSAERLSLFAYPLSGGFRSWSLLPAWAVRPLLRAEAVLMPVLGPLMAFRLMVVLARR